MSLTSLLGYLAAILTTLSFLPQAIKTIKEKNTDGISGLMYGLFTTGVLFWFIFGLFTKNFPVILANGVTFLLATTILCMKLKFWERKSES
jgi:MtN3 and saliva related transmembrane protein